MVDNKLPFLRTSIFKLIKRLLNFVITKKTTDKYRSPRYFYNKATQYQTHIK